MGGAGGAVENIRKLRHTLHRQYSPETLREEVVDLGLSVNPVAPHTGEHVVVTVHAYIPGALPVTVRVLL